MYTFLCSVTCRREQYTGQYTPRIPTGTSFPVSKHTQKIWGRILHLDVKLYRTAGGETTSQDWGELHLSCYETDKTDKYTNWANNKMPKSSCKHLRNQNVWPCLKQRVWQYVSSNCSPPLSTHKHKNSSKSDQQIVWSLSFMLTASASVHLMGGGEHSHCMHRSNLRAVLWSSILFR